MTCEDLIERLRDASLDHNAWRWGWLGEAIDELNRLRAEIANAVQAIDDLHDKRRKLEDERDALRVDAERYRFIRALDADAWDALFSSVPLVAKNEEVDAAIDAAMREKGRR